MTIMELKTKGGTIVKTSNGAIPVSPEQNGFFPNNVNYKLFIYSVLIPDVNPKTNKVTWYFKHGEHIDNNEKGVIEYIKNKYFAGTKAIFEKSSILLIIDMTDHAMAINSQYDPTLVDENRKGSYDKELHNGIIELGFTKRKKNMYGDRSFELFTIPKNWSTDEVKAKLENYHKGLLENKDVSIPTTVYDARPFTNDFDYKINNTDKCLLGGCPGSGKEAASLALTIRISDKKKYTNNLINVFTATIPDTLCEPLNELAVLKGMNVNGEFVDYNRIKLYIVESWFNSNKNDLSGKTQAYLRSNHTFIESADDIPTTHSSTEVPILIAGYHDIAYNGNEGKVRPKYASLEGRIGTLLVGEGHKFLKPGNKMWKVFTKLGWKFLMPVTGTPYDLIFGSDDVLYFPPEQRSIMTRQQMILDKLHNPNSDFKDMPLINYYGITEIHNEVIEKMRQDPRWKDDAEGMTQQKLHTAYDKDTKIFKYSEFLHRQYSRLLAPDGFGDYDGLAIKNAPGLCEVSKNNLLFILPVGMDGVSVKDYIPELVRQLKDSGALGVYEPFISYEDDMSDVKQAVEDPNKKTVTFTAIKNTTGTNIKGWGSTVLMRPVGDSLTFLEQGPEGRIGRASDGKVNSGLFLMEPYNAINLKVMVEESLSIERGENKSYSDIVNETLACHFFYNGTNGKFAQLEKPDFMSKLEEMSAKGNYDVNLCVKRTSAPDDFNATFKDDTKSETQKVLINDSGNKDAKNSKKKRLEQLELDLENNKGKNKDEFFHNMKRKMVAQLRILAFTQNLSTVQDCYNCLVNASVENNKAVLGIMGRTINYIDLLLDKTQFNLEYTNRWINKLETVKSAEDLLEMFSDPIHKTDTFVAEPNKVLKRITKNLLSKLKNKKNVSFLDGCGGRGGFIVYFLQQAGKYGVDIDPKNVYYNDIDSHMATLFRKVNKEYNLGIPEENITSEDFLTKEFKMKFSAGIINPPYEGKARTHQRFFNKLYSIIEDDGVMASLQPATTYFNKKNSHLTEPIIEEMISIIKDNLCEVEIENPEIFDNAGIQNDLSITYIVKDQCKTGLVDKITYKDSNVYKNILLKNISQTVIDPVLYSSIRTKYETFCNTHGNLEDIISKNKKDLKAALPKIRGTRPTDDDFYTFIPKVEKDFLNYYNESSSDFGITINSNSEKDNVYDYLRSYVARFGLALLKFSQNTANKEFALVPLIDFTKKYSDQDLFEILKITPQEEEVIKRVICNYYAR